MNLSAKARTLFLAIVFLAPAAAAGAETKLPQWYDDFAKASEKARQVNKPLLLDFWADWCASCKEMDDKVYSDSQLMRALSDKVLMVKVNFDREKDVARKYNVIGLPYIVFADSYGTELLHWEGVINPASLTQVVQALPSDVSEINRFDLILQKDKNNFEALAGMGRVLRTASLFIQSNQYYSQALKKDAAKKDPAAREVILLDMGNNWLELKQSTEAIKVFERAGKEYAHADNSDAIRLGLAQAYVLGNKPDKAKELLEALVHDPGGKQSQQARAMLDSLSPQRP